MSEMSAANRELAFELIGALLHYKKRGTDDVVVIPVELVNKLIECLAEV